MKNLFLACFLSVFCLPLNAQKKLRKVSKSELKEQNHPKDATADAAVLYDFTEISYRYDKVWKYDMEATKRVKVYNKKGYNEATIRIPFYTKSDNHKEDVVSQIKATTYNLEGKKIKSYKLKKEDIFRDDKRDFVSFMVFTLPNVQEGSVLEVSYQLTSSRVSLLPVQYFQDRFPVNYAAFKITLPKPFAYRRYDIGFEDLKVSEDVIKIRLPVDEVEGGLGGEMLTSAKEILIEAENLPAIKSENLVNTMDYYRASVRYEMIGHRSSLGSDYTYKSKTWEDVGYTLLEEEQIGQRLTSIDFLKPIVNDIVDINLGDLEKAKVIHEFVKSEMTWNSRKSILCKDLEEVFENKVGNLGEINMIQTAMMRIAGLTANPMFSSTRSNGVIVAPTLHHFNYLTTAVLIDDEYVIFDASDKFSAAQLLREDFYNGQGRILASDGELTKLNLDILYPSSENFEIDVDFYANNQMKGKYVSELNKFSANEFRRKYRSLSEEDYLDNLSNRSYGVEIFDHSITGLENSTKDLIEEFSFQVGEVGDEVGNQIMIKPLFFLLTSERKLMEEERNYPVDFSYPRAQEIEIKINFQDNLSLKSLPEDKKIILPNHIGFYEFKTEAIENGVLVKVRRNLNITSVNPRFYQQLRNFFETMYETENEYLILSKEQ